MTQKRLDRAIQNNALLLVALVEHKIVGFKFGYIIPDTRTFFSWLGGVKTEFRRQKIGKTLLLRQEQHALDMGLARIYFTSYDRYPEMIAMGKKQGYVCIRSQPDEGETKYWFEKRLVNETDRSENSPSSNYIKD